jgi:hypothetical protein
MTQLYYVYALSCPTSGQVRYVGKGQGNRAKSHWAAVKAGRNVQNSKLDTWLHALLTQGLEPIVTIIGSFQDERQAYALEGTLILSIPGLLNLSKGNPGMGVAPGAAEAIAQTEIERITSGKYRTDKALMWGAGTCGAILEAAMQLDPDELDDELTSKLLLTALSGLLSLEICRKRGINPVKVDIKSGYPGGKTRFFEDIRAERHDQANRQT